MKFPTIGRSGNGRGSGFTLLEVMVSTVIASVLIVVLVTLGMRSLDSWGSARSFARYQSSARAALDLLDSDLRTTLSRGRLPGGGDGSAAWLEARADETGSAYSVSLSFFSTVTDLDSGWNGDVVAVRHELLFQNPIQPGTGTSEEMVWALYRAVASPELTGSKALMASDIETEFWDTEEVGDPLNLIASNVVTLTAEFWIRGTDGSRVRADWVDGGFFRVDRNLEVSWDGSDETRAPHRLVGIDLAVEVVSDAGMAQIQDGRSLSEVRADERRVFSQYVPVLPES